MKEIILTQGKVTQVDDEDYDYLNQWKWFVHKNRNNYYCERNITILKNKQKQIGIHQIILERILGHNNFEMVDHIDGDGLNNQRNNLRAATNQQNSMNTKSKSIKGVTFCNYKKNKKWRVRIRLNKNVNIGYFNTQEEAAEAYNKKAIELFGEYAKLNEIKKV